MTSQAVSLGAVNNKSTWMLSVFRASAVLSVVQLLVIVTLLSSSLGHDGEHIFI
jgi:hypothetical protein